MAQCQNVIRIGLVVLFWTRVDAGQSADCRKNPNAAKLVKLRHELLPHPHLRLKIVYYSDIDCLKIGSNHV